MVKRSITALALAVSVASSAQAQTLSGRAYVLDGDTIEVGGVRVRLEGLPRYDPGGRYLPAQRDAGLWRGSMPGYC